MRITREIDRSANPAYAFDRSYRISYLNHGYQRFATENGGGPAFLARWGIGASLLQATSDVLVPFYRTLFDRALGGATLEHDFECHAPDRFRRFRMRLFPLETPAAVLVENTLVLERSLEPVEPGAGPDAIDRYRTSAGLIRQCAHCRRVQEPGTGEWHWVAALIARPAPGVSHGLCPICLERFYPE